MNITVYNVGKSLSDHIQSDTSFKCADLACVSIAALRDIDDTTLQAAIDDINGEQCTAGIDTVRVLWRKIIDHLLKECP